MRTRLDKLARKTQDGSQGGVGNRDHSLVAVLLRQIEQLLANLLGSVHHPAGISTYTTHLSPIFFEVP
jgi:hypothetical protein